MELDLMIEGQEGVTWEQWVAIAQACEQAGIPALFRSDHYLNLDGNHPDRGSLDAWGTLCGLAAVTTKLRLGTLVSPATFRHPSELARIVVTADHISGGRVELGLGAGWHEREHAANGFPYHELGTRMDVLEEQLAIVLGHWAATTPQAPFDFTGRHYRLEQLHSEPKPIQRPHVPLLMGGNAGPRACALAARFADEYNTVYPTVAEARERHARVTAACERAGRPAIPFSVMTAVITGRDRAEVAERAARVAAIRDTTAEELIAERSGEWLIGTVDEVAARLTELSDAGVARVMCQNHAHDDLELIDLIGRELVPRVA